MKYRITVKCCHKTYQLEASIFDTEELKDDSLARFVLAGLEHYKSEDGLEGMPHEIEKTELSLDGEVWFTSENFIK